MVFIYIMNIYIMNSNRYFCSTAVLLLYRVTSVVPNY